MQYDVFISYSRKDSEVADRICKAFDEAGISYFIDRQGIGGGFEFPTVLAEAIINCKIFLYLASENSYESRFTQSEITFAFNEKNKGSILPYIIDGSTMPPALRFVFSNINWRRLEEHPINTVLVDDLLYLLGKKRLIVPDNKIILSTPQYKKIDLGLSLCWADRNVGASSPEKCGDYFAWGETEPKSEYTKDTYKYYDKNKNTYANIGKDISGSKYDVARAKWGGNWRMPKWEDMIELKEKCSWQWTESNGVEGYKVTGPNGNSIFLPVTGYRYGEGIYNHGRGYYWSASMCDIFTAYTFRFNGGFNEWDRVSRYDGFTIRPVTD